MAVPPIPLQVGSNDNDTFNTINTNFSNAVQNIADLGASLSSGIVVPLVVGASSLTNLVVTLTSQGATSPSIYQVFTQKPVSSVTGITSYVDVYVDTDNDATKLWPLGTALGTGVSLYLISTVASSPYTGSLGAWIIQLNNRDTVSHTYYVHTKCGYFPTGSSGQFR